MTAAEFRRLALSLPEVVEASHMNHPDFRVGGKVFATLGYPKAGWGVVKLTPEQQEEFVQDKPGVFVPAAGAWGRQGSTSIKLSPATKPTVRRALVAAWLNTAPRKLHPKLSDAEGSP